MTIKRDASMRDLQNRMVESIPNLSPQLRKAATFVLDNQSLVGVSSISDFADAAQIKPNTLVRLARALGYEGYEAFREPFREAILKERQDFPDRARWLQSIARKGRYGELFGDMANGALSNIEALYAGITLENVKASAELILHARRTFVLGVGVSNSVTRNFAYLCGMAIETVTALPHEGNLPIDDIDRVQPDDVLVAVNFHPYRREVVQAARLARERGAYVIAVTDSMAAPFAAGAAYVFTVPTNTAQFFTSTVALTALFETLMAFIVADAPTDVVSHIENFHQRRQKLGVYWSDEDR